MSSWNTYAQPAVRAAAEDRAAFIRRTYMHLAMAVLLFIVLEFFMLQSSLPKAMLSFIAAGSYNWLMILGGFMILGWLARSFASSVQSPFLQYMGLLGYVLVEAVIFVPILAIAAAFSSPQLIPTAGIMTLLLFFGLTMTVFITRQDFSFLRSFLTIGFFIALGLIICGTIFGFDLGVIFSSAMVLLAAAAILYDTSNVLHHYRTDQHVAASLELFASVALLFWYVLRLLMAFSRD